MPKDSDSPGKTHMKKPYREPQLVAYGDILEITQAINTPTGNLDGTTTRRTPLRTGGMV